MQMKQLKTDEDYDMFVACVADYIYSYSTGHIGYILNEAINYALYESQISLGEDDSDIRNEACQILRRFLLEDKGILSQKT